MDRLIFPVTKKAAEKEGIPFSSQYNKNALFPSRLRELRKKKGISQDQLAKILGVSKSTLGLYETGDTLPDAKTLRDLAVYFEVSSDFLLHLSDYESKVSEEITAREMGLSEGFARGLKHLNKTPGGDGYIFVLNRLSECVHFVALIQQISRYMRKIADIKNKIDHLPEDSIINEERNVRLEKFLVSDVMADMLDELTPPPDWEASKEAARGRSKLFQEFLKSPECGELCHLAENINNSAAKDEVKEEHNAAKD